MFIELFDFIQLEAKKWFDLKPTSSKIKCVYFWRLGKLHYLSSHFIATWIPTR